MPDPLENGERSSSKLGSWERFVFDPAAFIAPEQPNYEGLLAKGDLAIWLGREKHRKSSVLLQFAICAALGRPFLHFLFHPSEGLKVVVLDYESKSQTIKNRYAAIVAAMGLSEAEQQTLRGRLRIVEMRKAFKNGLKFARFPVRPEKETRAISTKRKQSGVYSCRGWLPTSTSSIPCVACTRKPKTTPHLKHC